MDEENSVKYMFSESICRKFPEQTKRHEVSFDNARWLLKSGIPTEPLTKEEKIELLYWMRRATFTIL